MQACRPRSNVEIGEVGPTVSRHTKCCFHHPKSNPLPRFNWENGIISGMKLLLGAFAQAWNRRYRRRGHVFQGRYKSIPVSGELASDGAQFGVVADSIHLNPARAKRAGGRKGALVDYSWSSLKHYSGNRGPDWLVRERVLAAFQLARNGRGRRAYVCLLYTSPSPRD